DAGAGVGLRRRVGSRPTGGRRLSAPCETSDRVTIDETGTATLTFLFSDVEGSTALLRKLRDGYSTLMGEHERLLRTAWAEGGGQELDAGGDSFSVASRRPRQAVDAAVAAQRAVAAHSWPEGVELRVRIGIHTGEASVAGDQPVGLAVHRAARICDAGHGG